MRTQRATRRSRHPDEALRCAHGQRRLRRESLSPPAGGVGPRRSRRRPGRRRLGPDRRALGPQASPPSSNALSEHPRGSPPVLSGATAPNGRARLGPGGRACELQLVGDPGPKIAIRAGMRAGPGILVTWQPATTGGRTSFAPSSSCCRATNERRSSSGSASTAGSRGLGNRLLSGSGSPVTRSVCSKSAPWPVSRLPSSRPNHGKWGRPPNG